MACAFSFLMGPCPRNFFLFVSGFERGNVRLSLTVTFQRATHFSSNLTGTSLGSEPGECLRDTLTLVKTLEHSPEHQILCVSVYMYVNTRCQLAHLSEKPLAFVSPRRAGSADDIILRNVPCDVTGLIICMPARHPHHPEMRGLL